MAAGAFDDRTFNPVGLDLLPNEQSLLMTALNSNKQNGTKSNQQSQHQNANTTPKTKPQRSSTNESQSTRQNSGSVANYNNLYDSPSNGTISAPNSGFDASPYLDFDLEDGNFDWDASGDQMIGALPGDVNDDDENDIHEKRKSHDDDEDDGGGKRREGDEKGGRKPGRKPLTSEPTTKRKAQNRAAQRAFRERKEKHLKDLESKVDDLEKASEAANHENGLLRAQVERLSTELKEYRKRMSLNGSGARNSPPQPQSTRFDWETNNFQFEFPRFGGGPKVPAPTRSNSKPMSPGSVTNAPSVTRGNSFPMASPPSNNQIPSPAYTNNSFHSNDMNDLTTLFSPSVVASASRSNSSDMIPQLAGQSPLYQRQHANDAVSSRVPLKSHTSASDTTSPSASGSSQNGLDSSCGTTPEPSADSPKTRKASETPLNTIIESGLDDEFAQQNFSSFNNPNNTSLFSNIENNNENDNATAFPTIEWWANQNGNAFDPVLFGDYRDPQENIMNNEFGFFNDAFATADFGSPKNNKASPAQQQQQQQTATQPLSTQLPKKRDLIHEIEESQNGHEPEVVPGETRKQFLTCNMLWDRVQRSERIQSGEADMDDLCSQLKAKAKCSGSGAVIDTKDVDAILGPIKEDSTNGDQYLKMFM